MYYFNLSGRGSNPKGSDPLLKGRTIWERGVQRGFKRRNTVLQHLILLEKNWNNTISIRKDTVELTFLGAPFVKNRRQIRTCTSGSTTSRRQHFSVVIASSTVPFQVMFKIIRHIYLLRFPSSSNPFFEKFLFHVTTVFLKHFRTIFALNNHSSVVHFRMIIW